MGVGLGQEGVRLAKFLHTLEVFKENQWKTLDHGYCVTKRVAKKFNCFPSSQKQIQLVLMHEYLKLLKDAFKKKIT